LKYFTAIKRVNGGNLSQIRRSLPKSPLKKEFKEAEQQKRKIKRKLTQVA